MLTALKFVQGAVSRKDFVPALQHYRIRNGLIKSFNGTVGMCAPIACDLDVTPRADVFTRAIEACGEETVSLHVSESGRLVVNAGAFRTNVECVEAEAFPELEPVGRIVKLAHPILPALKYLAPFIAEDASRGWACGVLFRGESAFATNNIVLLEYWLGAKFPHEVNVPVAAVLEILRIGENPTQIQINDRRIFFHFEGGRWLSSQVLEAQWPDVGALLESKSRKTKKIPTGLFDVVEKLLPFVDELGRVYLLGDKLATHDQPDKVGTSIALPNVPTTGCYNARQLIKLRGVATAIAFDAYPEPCWVEGDVARGIIVGFRT